MPEPRRKPASGMYTLRRERNLRERTLYPWNLLQRKIYLRMPKAEISMSGIILPFTCRRCEGNGITNHGVYALRKKTPIAEYLRHGLACVCAAGERFMAQQMEYFEQGETATWPKRKRRRA